MAKNILDWFDAWQLGLQNSSLASSAAGSQEHLGRLDDANTVAIGDDIEIQNAGEDVVEPSLVNSEKPVGEELSGGDLAWPIAQSVSGQSTGAFNASQEAKSDVGQAGHHQPEAAREAASEILTALVPKVSVNPPVGTDGPTFSTLEKSNYTNSTSASYLDYGKSVSQSIPTDPLLSQQWHLGNTGGLLDLNVRSVWSPTEGPAYTGAGTRTVVIDDGFDYNHQDFDNYDQSLDFDFDGSDLDPFGTASDAHGTAVAGIIGAAADGTGAVGVAYGTSLVGYRTNGFISDFWLQNVRDTIHHAAMSAGADLANISQGIANDTNSEYGAGYNAIRFDEIETSIGTAVNNGRGGLGMTIIKSAGNSRSANYDVNADDWTNDTRQVVVAAVNQNGFVSSYSSYGAALLVSGFGTPGQVVTTDRTGAAGYNSTDFTSSFNGTSAAAPMVSGVVALMYDANAALGWRDVQTILGVSARQVGSEVGAGTAGSERYDWQFNAASTWNGGGQHFSNDYGYGLVDAHAAVRLAETWLLTGTEAAASGNQFTNTIDVLNASVVIPDGNATGTTFSGNAGFDDIVERVTVSMTFSTTWLSDLELYLISPDGTVSELIDDVAGDANFNGTWTFESQAFRGERAGGAWSVRVVDDSGSDVLTVSDIVIRTYGAFTFDDRYVYTNEYSDYAGLFGHVTAVTDSNGGTDTVNASAVTTGSAIRLDGGVGAIDGIGTTFSNIENAIGGDGSDIIVGSIGNNQLFGMRGNDTLDGGGGIDTINAGTGDDIVVDANPNTSGDFFDGGEGVDTLIADFAWNPDVTYDLTAGWMRFPGPGGTTYDTILNFENLTAGGAADVTGTIAANVVIITDTGSFHNNTISTLAGNDTISSGIGNDTINAGAGNDSVLAGDGDDVITDTEAMGSFDDDVYDGGNGIDTLVHNLNWVSSVTFDLTAGFSTFGGNRDQLISIENLTVGGDATVNGSEDNNVLTVIGSGNNVINGQGGDDLIDAGGGNDTLDGGNGTDTLRGGAGNDVLVQNFGGPNEILDGGEDNDTGDWSYSTSDSWTISLVDGTATIGSTVFAELISIENVVGGQLSDSIIGNGLDNVLDGQAGNDTLDGGNGTDTLRGGAGNDVLIQNFGGPNEILDGGEDNDTGDWSYSTFDNWTISLVDGTATIGSTVFAELISIENVVGGQLSDTIIGNGLDNVLDGQAGNDTLDGGDGTDTLRGGAGNDVLVQNFGGPNEILDGGEDNDTGDWSYSTSDSWIISLVDGTARIGSEVFAQLTSIENVVGGQLSDTIIGNGLDNVLDGQAGNDSLVGGAGNDTLNGGAGIDTLTGGAGSDTYLIETVGDLVLEFNPDPVTGGVDTVLSSLAAYTLTANVENLTLTGAAAINGTGNTLNNLITGNTAANSLDGGAGADTLNGAAGIDTLTGGDGNDTYIIETVGDLVVETNAVAATGGVDTVLSSLAAYTLTAHVENLTLTGAAAINGTGNTLNNVITGNTAANSLTGDAGNDTLNGGAGIDTMIGGAGSDTYLIETVGDLVLEFNPDPVTGGVDTVLSSLAAYTLTANVENLTLTGAAAINGTGNTLNNVITGNTAANSLDGGAGADTLTGAAGIDTLTGGDGNDTYIIETVGDLVVETNAVAATGGVDTVLSSLAAYTLTAHVENLTLTGAAVSGTGNTLNNVITGNTAANSLTGDAGNDTLNGGAGIDTLTGGAGSDTYLIETVGDLVLEFNPDPVTGGVDTVLSSLAAYTLTANVENLTLTGAAAINGTGNTLNNVIIGNTAANSLDGGAGADTLTGAAGIDTLTGGDGNDTYIIETVGDLVVETNAVAATGGVDTVLSSLAAYTLTAHVENLTLTGAAAINGTGNTLNNVITGNTAANSLTGDAGNDTLNGGAGIDTMIGGAGSDTYLIETVGDLVLEFNPDPVTGGVDTVLSSLAAYTLTANVENLTLTGAAAINGTGNTLNNVITGNTAANILNGGAGIDTLIGGAGSDTYLIETVGDLVLEFNPDPVTGGVDTVLSSLAAYTLTANVENLTLTGAALSGTGNTLNNVITGNTAANSLSGGVGADTLNGAAGNDTLTGGLNADTFRFDSLLNDATNRDLITDFTIAQGDRIELENSIFTALTPTGTLASSAFSFGAAATNVDQRILYDSAVGSLLYDSDGSTLGGVSAIAFATLTPGLMTLTHTSFTIT
jgi:Ca2+-binding RTX toxin-like protein/subtilisin-like proprotein convertase family protein